MFRLLVTTLNNHTPVNTCIERFESYAELTAAKGALDGANQRAAYHNSTNMVNRNPLLFYYLEL